MDRLGDLRSDVVRGRETRAQRDIEHVPKWIGSETFGQTSCGVGRPAHSET